MQCSRRPGTTIGAILLAGGISFLLAGCDGTPPLVRTQLETMRFTGSGDEFLSLPTNQNSLAGHYAIDIDSGDTPLWRLYFVITNTGSDPIPSPNVSVLQAPLGMASGTSIRAAEIETERSVTGKGSYEPFVMPTVEHAPPPSTPLPSLRTTAPRAGRAIGKAGETDPSCGLPVPNNSVNDIETFLVADSRDTVVATARVVRTVGEQRAVFWVPEALYAGCRGEGCLPASGLLTEDDIVRIADSFLKDGDDNDMHDWIQDITGTHWDADGVSCTGPLISPAHKQQVDFLLFNLDNRSQENLYDGGVIGYYLPINNFRKTVLADLPSALAPANARLLLYVHAPWFKLSDEYLWRFSPLSRAAIRERFFYRALSIMAHEYQHLIHFYQRSVLNGDFFFDDAWLNEHLSVMTEDLLYSRVTAGNPNTISASGVNAFDEGRPLICDGRIWNYLYDYGSTGVSEWSNGLWNYGINFSFGAYLLRNYGGENFMIDAYEAAGENDAALSYALNRHTAGLDMGEAVHRWGVAKLLSDDVNAPAGYRMNGGVDGFRMGRPGRSSYQLGSINYHNYASTRSCIHGGFRVFNGRYINNDISLVTGGTQAGHANVIVAAAENLRGTARFGLTLADGHAVTVVGKRVPTRYNPVVY